MYIPQHFEETDTAVLHKVINDHPFATWVSVCEGELDANHIPFVLDLTQGEKGVLKGHVARANPVWQTLKADNKSLIIFQGADSYISPSWYSSKHENENVVPTWNFIVVHVKGRITLIEDETWLLSHLNELTDEHEAKQKLPWKVSDAPKDYIDHMLKNIVGLELPIDTLEGKWKLSQNKSEKDKFGIITGLEASARESTLAMAALMKGIK